MKYAVEFKVLRNQSEIFQYNKRETCGENFYIFHNTEKHEFVALFRYQIIRYIAL